MAILIILRHLAVEQRLEFKEMAKKTREQALQIPDAVEKALINHLGQRGQLLNRLQRDVRNTSEQHIQAMQQVVRSLPTFNALKASMFRDVPLLCPWVKGVVIIRFGFYTANVLLQDP